MFAVLNHSQGRQTPVVSIGVIFLPRHIVVVSF
nr:MAG TPA: hypothetical protein [Caudoviricetes sp.]